MNLPNFDGAKGKASRFISDFLENMEAHGHNGQFFSEVVCEKMLEIFSQPKNLNIRIGLHFLNVLKYFSITDLLTMNIIGLQQS